MKQFPQPVPNDPLDDAARMLTAGWRQLLDVMRAELQEQVAQLKPAVEPFNMLSIKQACAFFQVSDYTLRQWERDGLLVPFRAGKVVLYDTRSIDAFVQARQGEPLADEREVA